MRFAMLSSKLDGLDMVACVSMGSRHFGQQNVGIAVRHWVMSLHRPPDKGSPL